MIKSLVVVGGGTAGLVSAIYLRAAFPNLKITLIESSKIGIIGVGEGSTEHWKTFMEATNITVPDLIREAGATFKIGINFVNWNGDNKNYFHSIPQHLAGQDLYSGIGYIYMHLIANNCNPLDTAWHKTVNSYHAEPLEKSSAQFHFDTFKLNKYFHKLCNERNITVVDDDISEVILDDQGFVKTLVGDKDSYSGDFFIDSTGFKRLISTKLGAKWIDVTDQLPMNSAIAFPTEYQEDIPSHTLSEALDAGWRWRIPTQERFGNGYVFCDSFIDETQAFDEIQKKFNKPITVGKKVKFSAGYLDQFWIKNCVSVGLSGMFVEPLEASSIGNTIQLMRILVPSLATWTPASNSAVKKYNTDAEKIATNIVDFIQLHYFTKREDTEFWRWVKHNIKITDFNKEYLEEFKNNFVGAGPFNENIFLMFSHLNFAQVMHGLGMFNTNNIKNILEETYPHLDTIARDRLKTIPVEEETFTYYKHRDALEELKKRGLEWTYQLGIK